MAHNGDNPLRGKAVDLTITQEFAAGSDYVFVMNKGYGEGKIVPLMDYLAMIRANSVPWNSSNVFRAMFREDSRPGSHYKLVMNPEGSAVEIVTVFKYETLLMRGQIDGFLGNVTKSMSQLLGRELTNSGLTIPIREAVHGEMG